MRLRKPCVLALLRRFGWYVRFIKLLYERFRFLEQPSEYIRSLVSHPASKSHNEASAITALRRESNRKVLQNKIYIALLTPLWMMVLVRLMVVAQCFLHREWKLSKLLSTVVDKFVDNYVNILQRWHLTASAIALWRGVR